RRFLKCVENAAATLKRQFLTQRQVPHLLYKSQPRTVCLLYKLRAKAIMERFYSSRSLAGSFFEVFIVFPHGLLWFGSQLQETLQNFHRLQVVYDLAAWR